jgi:uncharacterized protein (DUF427 family)
MPGSRPGMTIGQEPPDMKAVLKDRVIAESDDIVEHGGYHYFPSTQVRLELLDKAAKTASICNVRMASSSTMW